MPTHFFDTITFRNVFAQHLYPSLPSLFSLSLFRYIRFSARNYASLTRSLSASPFLFFSSHKPTLTIDLKNWNKTGCGGEGEEIVKRLAARQVNLRNVWKKKKITVNFLFHTLQITRKTFELCYDIIILFGNDRFSIRRKAIYLRDQHFIGV